MALTAKGLLAELDGGLDARSASTNRDIRKIVAGDAPAAPDLNASIDRLAEKCRKLIDKGRRADVEALIDKWRKKRPPIRLFAPIPNMRQEFETMYAMLDDVLAGGSLDASLATGNEAERRRYSLVKSALDDRPDFLLVLDEIVRRSGL